MRVRERARSGVYVNFREVVGRLQLAPGHYVVIPSTYDRHQMGTFLLRFFSDKQLTVRYSNKRY